MIAVGELGDEHPLSWWIKNWPTTGTCSRCGGECDGTDCGLHAAGCVFGGPDNGVYWLIAEGCPLWHGEAAS